MISLKGLKDKLSGKIAQKPTLKATMMGPRAVGKTSLMASIFNETRDTVAGAGFFFVPTDETAKDLSIKNLQLKNIIETRKSIQDAPQTGAIEASSTETTFCFEMGLVGRASSINVQIKDFPGEYLVSNPQKVTEFIQESSVIMVAIDTPYLMEDGGKYNEAKNDVKRVTRFLEQNSDTIKDKMILLIPLKSERYFHDNRLEELNAKVKQVYAKLIDVCSESNIACVITPIQTLGHVEFDKFVDNSMGYGTLPKLSRFRFYGENPRFLPMFCVQPLYYTLTYVANQYEWISHQPKGLMDRMKNSILAYLKDDDDFFHEIKKMGEHIKYEDDGYEIVVTNTIFKLK